VDYSDNTIDQRSHYGMKDNINPDNDGYDPSEEYFKKKENTNDYESEVYYPQETSKPPHY
tara:strand:+ start:862 stop:1041 length:180 start_codon:yes stop_codon:yes gene_type:complete